MNSAEVHCSLSRRQLIDEYFIENRTRILDIAAFLDRLDRAGADSNPQDFRMEAMERALGILTCVNESRVMQIQMIFSDPTEEPKAALDQKSAKGAYDPRAADSGSAPRN